METSLENKIKELDSDSDHDDFDEFMRKVNEVNSLVNEFLSEDKQVVKKAEKASDLWLAENSRTQSSDTTEQVINNSCPKKLKNVINYNKPPKKPQEEGIDDMTGESMSQEAFMRTIEADAKKRSKERKKRNKESDALKVEGNKAFRSQDFEKALDYYNQAIAVRKDSLVLYTNRALTLIHLGLYTKALTDCEWALKVYEHSFKARLYMARAHHGMGELEDAAKVLQETKELFPQQLQLIQGSKQRYKHVCDVKVPLIAEYRDSWPEEDDED